MQKKIGIITFHNSVNYGALLQTYALSRVLANEGFIVEIIDYVNDKIDHELSSSRYMHNKSFKGFVKYCIKRVHGYRKDKSFSNFINSELELSRERNITREEIKKLAGRYDVVITGSDQVWNSKITDMDMTYYLDFVAEGTKRIAYAVSGGDVVDDDISNALPLIKRIDALSVREQSLSDLLFERYDVVSAVCLDPTLLAGKKLFKPIVSNRLIKKRYIFCFMMDYKPEIIEVAKQIANEKGLVVIDNKNSLQFFLHSSPKDYLSWIYNAEYVLTDSFHGTALSIVFNKQFISDVYDGKGRIKQRIGDLLKTLSLEERFKNVIVDDVLEISRVLDSSIDYSAVENKRLELAQKSHTWLVDAINM